MSSTSTWQGIARKNSPSWRRRQSSPARRYSSFTAGSSR